MKKLYREPLNPEWADALLVATSTSFTGEGVPIYRQLQNAKELLNATVLQATETLRVNPLTGTVANAAARLAGRRGSAKILVDPSGVLFLEVTPEVKDATRKVSNLPSLESLRKEAADLGIPLDKVGRSKRLLMTTIETVKAQKTVTDGVPVVKKPRKTKVAADPVPEPLVPEPDKDLPYPMASELPKDLLDPPFGS